MGQTGVLVLPVFLLVLVSGTTAGTANNSSMSLGTRRNSNRLMSSNALIFFFPSCVPYALVKKMGWFKGYR